MSIVAVGIAAALGLCLAILLFLVYRKVDYRVDQFQRGVNKLENLFAMSGATWISELLEDMVVGDEYALLHKLRDVIEAHNSVEVFLDKVGVPITKFTLTQLSAEDRKKLLKDLPGVQEADQVPTDSPKVAANDNSGT